MSVPPPEAFHATEIAGLHHSHYLTYWDREQKRSLRRLFPTASGSAWWHLCSGTLWSTSGSTQLHNTTTTAKNNRKGWDRSQMRLVRGKKHQFISSFLIISTFTKILFKATDQQENLCAQRD